jgi:hypothetical protein
MTTGDHTADHPAQADTQRVRVQGAFSMKNFRGIIAMVAIAFAIAIGAMAGTAANGAIVPTVGLETATYLDAQNIGDPSGPLTVLGVALTGIGILLLRGRPIRQL